MSNKVKILDRRFVPAGELVIEQGSIGNRAFLIERGKVEVFMRDKKGRNVKIAEAGAGAIIGEMAVLGDGQRSASIRTIEDTVLVTISGADLEKSLEGTDGLYQKMMKLLVERLRDTNARLLAQNMELAELEEAAQMTVKNISLHVPEGKQKAFKREVVPLLDKLKSTLGKYNQL